MCLFSTELRLFPLHWKAKVGARRLWTQPEVSSPGHQLPSRTFRLDSFHGKYFYFHCWAFNGIQGEFLVMLTKDLSHSYLFFKAQPKESVQLAFKWKSNRNKWEWCSRPFQMLSRAGASRLKRIRRTFWPRISFLCLSTCIQCTKQTGAPIQLWTVLFLISSSFPEFPKPNK